jgi:glycosyltransferase involved in cell wall biosynthesis
VSSEPDRGISDAFNKGLAMARGELVGFLSADDWYEPGALASVAQAHRARPADVYCGRQRYWQGERPGAVFDADPSLLPRFMSVNHIASFARRSLFARHGGFRLDYRAAMDYELYLRFRRRGARFERVDEVLANMSLGGVSDRRWREGLREVRRAQRENGAGWPSAQWSYLFHLAKGSVRWALERAGARGLVALYRERVARVRKAR